MGSRMKLVLTVLLAAATCVLLTVLWSWVLASTLLSLGGAFGGYLAAGVVGTVLLIWGAISIEAEIGKLNWRESKPSAPDSEARARGPWDRQPR